MSESKKKFYFLSEEEARFFEALCNLIIPTGQDPKLSPGSIEVGSVDYVDSTLLDFPKEEQEYFRQIIDLVNKASWDKFNREFSAINDCDKSIVLKSLYLDPNTRERVFDLRSIVLEGFYSDYHDPGYRGTTAWGFIQFGGKRISDLKKDWSFLKIWRDYEKKQVPYENAH